jgi:DNA polymerase-3 subunit delta
MAQGRKKNQNDSYHIFRDQLKERSFCRVYLFFGEEAYLLRQNMKELTAALIPEGDTMNLNIHKDGRISAGQLKDEAMSMPFFSDYRMILAENTGLFAPGADEGETAAMLSFLPEIPQTSVLLFSEDKVDKRSRMYKAVQKNGLAVEFLHPDADTLRRWVLGRFRREKVSITGTALEHLLELTGDDMVRISSETEKLIVYAGEGGGIQIRDVDDLVSARIEDRVFDMIESVTRRERGRVLRLYGDLLQLKERPERILALISRQYNLLMLTKSMMERGRGYAQIQEALGLKFPSLVRKYMDQAGGIRGEELRQAVEDCARTEEHIKTGRISGELGVELLLVKYSSPR